MKLWQVIQWGNPVDGGNGPETQCIISAVDMESAIAEGNKHIQWHNSFVSKDTHGWEAEVVYLLGEDFRPDGDPIVIVPVWVAHSFNDARSPAWHRHPKNGWMTQEEMYGPDKE
jgi:hypothetical protein